MSHKKTQWRLRLCLFALFVGGCSHGTGSPQTALPKTPPGPRPDGDVVQLLPNERGKAVPVGPIIGHLETRDKRITVRSGPDGPVYTVKSDDGKILAEGVPQSQLLARFPELESLVEHGIAADDARLRPAIDPAPDRVLILRP